MEEHGVGSGQRHGGHSLAAAPGPERGRDHPGHRDPTWAPAGRLRHFRGGAAHRKRLLPVTVAWQRRRGAAMADEAELPVVTFGNLMSEGITLSRRGQHDKALGCFNDVRAPRPEGTELPTAGGASGGPPGRDAVRFRRDRRQRREPRQEGEARRDMSPGGLCARSGPDGVVQGQGSACSTYEKQEKTLFSKILIVLSSSLINHPHPCRNCGSKYLDLSICGVEPAQVAYPCVVTCPALVTRPSLWFQALKLRAGDKRCLITRSRCFLKLGDTENSLKDAEASLQIDKTFSEVTAEGVGEGWPRICETLQDLRQSCEERAHSKHS